MRYQPKKRFGQNFLQDAGVVAQILDAINPKRHDRMIEIGPGQGALTYPLLRAVDQLTAIEIDRTLAAGLRAKGSLGLSLIEQDALTVDYAQWGAEVRVVGNLPYNISTPLVLYLLRYAACIHDMHFMLQKEVVDRLCANPGTRAYGRLSVMVQYYCTVIPLFDVAADAFFPQPKVTSSVVRLIPHRVLPYAPVAWDVLEAFVARAFAMKRKTLRNNLKAVCDAGQLLSCGIAPDLRPEAVAVEDYARMAAMLCEV